MIQILINKPLMLEAAIFNALEGFEWFEKIDTRLTYNIRDGIAVIPVHGLLTRRREALSCIYGTTSYEEIQNAILQAQKDEQVQSILLDMDSPGGEVSGLFDLVDFIYKTRSEKLIYSLANDSAFSAAYAIASATSKIFINRTSGVGSVGVIATHMNISEADKKLGVQYTTVYAGAKKNDLSPHEPLTDGAVADLQREVNRLYDIFVETVARNREISAEAVKATQAGTYFGKDALKIGFADSEDNPIIELKEFGAKPNGVLFQAKGVEMEEENTNGNSVLDMYRAEILEITRLCKLAHMEDKISEFIEQEMSVEQVKDALLTAMSAKEEILSMNYHKEAVVENPVIAAVKNRAGLK